MSTEWLSALKTLDHVTVKAIKDNTSRISYRVGLPAPTLLLMIEFASAALPVVLLIMWAIDAAIYQITPEFNLGLVFNLVGLMAIMAIGATINLLFATILQSIHYWVEYEEASKTPRFSGMSYFAWGEVLAGMFMLLLAFVVSDYFQAMAVMMSLSCMVYAWDTFYNREQGNKPKRRKRRKTVARLTIAERLAQVVPHPV